MPSALILHKGYALTLRGLRNDGRRLSFRFLCLCALLTLLCPAALAEAETELTPREQMIDEILNAAHDQYVKTEGKLRRAHYSGDIYVCKNFTTYLFNQNKADFCMSEFPDVKLVIPNNLPAEKCKPYAYGFLWQDVSASKGNPFYVAAQFRYDSDLTADA